MWNLEDKQLFKSGALGELRTAKIELAETVVDAAVDAFQPNEEENVINEIVRFREFIKGMSFKLRHADLERLTVSLSVPAGDGTISIGLTGNLQPLNRETGEFASLSDAEIAASSVAMVKQLFSVLGTIRQNAPAIQPRQQQQQQNGNGGATEQQHKAEKLVVENYNGKSRFRIKAGWFMAFGAPVYEEVLKACGYENVLNFAPGEYDFKHDITVKVDENKKPKVIAIN